MRDGGGPLLVVFSCDGTVAEHEWRLFSGQPCRLSRGERNAGVATRRLYNQSLCQRRAGYLSEDPVSLDAAAILPGLRAAGVTALKIEGRQRSRAYIESVVRGFREQLDALEAGEKPPADRLAGFTEGQSSTLGAYRKTWR